MQGWIKFHRQVCENELYFAERFTKMQAWFDLLLLACHKPQTVFMRGVEIKLKPGELCYSQLSLAKRWGWNFKTVKNFLSSLEKREMLETKTSNVTTVISIRNWSKYQGNGEQNGDQNGEQKESKTETNKNDKNEKNEERERPSLPSLETTKAFFREENFRNPEVEAQKFWAFYQARNWEVSGVLVSDWKALGRLWDERTIEYAKGGNGHALSEHGISPTGYDPNDESWRQIVIACSDCGKTIKADEVCGCLN